MYEVTYFFSKVRICVSETVGNMAPILVTACSVSVLKEVSCVLEVEGTRLGDREYGILWCEVEPGPDV